MHFQAVIGHSRHQSGATSEAKSAPERAAAEPSSIVSDRLCDTNVSHKIVEISCCFVHWLDANNSGVTQTNTIGPTGSLIPVIPATPIPPVASPPILTPSGGGFGFCLSGYTSCKSVMLSGPVLGTFLLFTVSSTHTTRSQTVLAHSHGGQRRALGDFVTSHGTECGRSHPHCRRVSSRDRTNWNVPLAADGLSCELSDLLRRSRLQ